MNELIKWAILTAENSNTPEEAVARLLSILERNFWVFPAEFRVDCLEENDDVASNLEVQFAEALARREGR